MVGSMYQAEIPVGISKYKENEKGKVTGNSFSLRLQLRIRYMIQRICREALHLFILRK